MPVIALIRRRRRGSDLRARRLAVGLGVADWPHRGRLPRTWAAKLAHVAIGMVLGAAFAAVILAWL